jgi:hypothetical protein
MKNDENSRQAKMQAKSELKTVLKAAATKGRFSLERLDAVTEKMSAIVDAKFEAGARGSDMRSIIEAYLPSVLAEILGGAPEKTTNQEVFGARVGARQSELAGLVAERDGRGSFFDSYRADPDRPQSSSDAGTVAVSGSNVTKDEVKDYFTGTVGLDSDAFSILLWLGEGRNPMLLLEELSYAKRLHNEIVVPVAAHYKRILHGDPNYPLRIGKILCGIITPEDVRNVLKGGATSRHLIGQAVNFSIEGVDDSRVVDDIANGIISVDYGTLALTTGVHATLPFYAANGQMVRRMRLWTDAGVPGFVGYEFN